MAKFSNDFYISLNYFNGKFQAQIGRDYGRYSHCNSKEMLKMFERCLVCNRGSVCLRET